MKPWRVVDIKTSGGIRIPSVATKIRRELAERKTTEKSTTLLLRKWK